MSSQGNTGLAIDGVATNGRSTMAISSKYLLQLHNDMVYRTNLQFLNRKHLNTHNKQVPCEAGIPGGCSERFADNKARNRHYWVSHKKYAKENNIPNEKCFCEPCGKSFSRRDNFRRHVDNHHSHEAEGREGKMVIDDKYETIDCEDGEYARICRLRNTE